MKTITTIRLGRRRPADLPDQELIAECLAGNAEAWDALIERYAPLINTAALRMGLTASDAADILQDVSVIVFNCLADLRDHAKLAPWIVSTTRREVWRLRRRRGPRLQSELTEAEQSEFERTPDNGYNVTAEHHVLELERQFEVSQAMQRLPERCRRLLTLLYVEDPPAAYAEIAARLAIPPGSIGPTRARCLQNLRKLLGS